MQFKLLDEMMRVYETAHDYSVLPNIYIVARLDGRNFTRLTKEKHQFKAPFDEKFRDYMLITTEHLMTCGFKVVYGYTQSDEIENKQIIERSLFRYNKNYAFNIAINRWVV